MDHLLHLQGEHETMIDGIIGSGWAFCFLCLVFFLCFVGFHFFSKSLTRSDKTSKICLLENICLKWHQLVKFSSVALSASTAMHKGF